MSPPVLEFASAKASTDASAIPPITELLRLFVGRGDGWADPYAGQKSPAQHRHHGEAAAFLGRFPDESLQGIILDQTTSRLRPMRESGESVVRNAADPLQVEDMAAKKIIPGGLAICSGPNSNGLGAERGFELIHVLNVRHGGDQADTIVTVEIKVPYQAADDPTADELAALRSQDKRRAARGRLKPMLATTHAARGRVDQFHGEESASNGQAPTRPLRLPEVVKFSGRSASTIRRAIKDGTLQAHRIGRGKKRPTYEIHPDDLNRYIEASRVQPPDSPNLPTIKVRKKSRHFD